MKIASEFISQSDKLLFPIDFPRAAPVNFHRNFCVEHCEITQEINAGYPKVSENQNTGSAGASNWQKRPATFPNLDQRERGLPCLASCDNFVRRRDPQDSATFQIEEAGGHFKCKLFEIPVLA